MADFLDQLFILHTDTSTLLPLPTHTSTSSNGFYANNPSTTSATTTAATTHNITQHQANFDYSVSSNTKSKKRSSRVKRKKPKKHTIGKRPKRAACGYIYFAKLKRAEILEKHGIEKSDIGGSGKLLGKVWRQMSTEDRTQYDRLAAVDKLRYEKELRRWKSEQPVNVKNPCSAYAFFVKEIRPVIVNDGNEGSPKKTFAEVGKELGKRWKRLNAQGRRKYNTLAAEDVERFNREERELNL